MSTHLLSLCAMSFRAINHPDTRPHVQGAARNVLQALRAAVDIESALAQTPEPQNVGAPPQARDLARYALSLVASQEMEVEVRTFAALAAAGALVGCAPSLDLARCAIKAVSMAAQPGINVEPVIARVLPWSALRGEVGDLVRAWGGIDRTLPSATRQQLAQHALPTGAAQ